MLTCLSFKHATGSDAKGSNTRSEMALHLPGRRRKYRVCYTKELRLLHASEVKFNERGSNLIVLVFFGFATHFYFAKGAVWSTTIAFPLALSKASRVVV
jgi:hypothetical protein